MKANDLTNQKFGKLTAIHRVEGGSSKWLCKCDCGVEKIIYATNLMNGRSTSCGCSKRKHGDSTSKLYNIHAQVLRSGVCDEWKDYENFRDWVVSNGWHEGARINRKDTEKEYSPDNCEIKS